MTRLDGSRRLRSLLFAPGNEQRKLDKALSAGADAVVFDLEDAVPSSQKTAARAAVRATLERGPYEVPVLVRVNALASPHLHDDLDAAVTPNTSGVVLPKTESPGQLVRVAELIADRERARNLRPGQIAVIALIETAAGVEEAAAISRTRGARLARTILGTVDLAADLGLPVGQRNPVLDHAAARLVIAARAAGLPPPLDGPYTHLDDPGGYREDCHRSAAAGMAGRVILHPAQLAAAHSAYSGDRSLDWHRQVVAAFEEAERGGVASIRLSGEFIDYPVYAASRRIVEEAVAAAAQESCMKART
jgi:citrate lyase subunit beta / citryl-CoA lyase